MNRTRPFKPELRRQPTTLWEYPSQHYGEGMQGSASYVGATPSYVIWNVIQTYTKPGDLVVDPFCGSGTTLDVAKDTGRTARGFDLAPYRADIERADARKLPLLADSVDLVFMDPPYGDHIDYSPEANCIGKQSAYEPGYFKAMHDAMSEAVRVLKPGGVLAVYVCDSFDKRQGFAPVGFALFSMLAEMTIPLDMIAVTRHHKSLDKGNFRKAAEEGGFFLRGFNYLMLGRKPEPRAPRTRRGR